MQIVSLCPRPELPLQWHPGPSHPPESTADICRHYPVCARQAEGHPFPVQLGCGDMCTTIPSPSSAPFPENSSESLTPDQSRPLVLEKLEKSLLNWRTNPLETSAWNSSLPSKRRKGETLGSALTPSKQLGEGAAALDRDKARSPWTQPCSVTGLPWPAGPVPTLL